MYPSLSNGWTSWDDNIYVTDNPFITDISVNNLNTVFTRVLDGSYAPFTMVSYMIDYNIGVFNPKVYHATSLLLHLCNSSLVFWLVFQLSGNFIASFVAGVLFGIHPMHVESVAWISGRKDVLSMFFFLLSSISYLAFMKAEKSKWLTVSFLFFLCAILSKVIVLTFPIILFLYDYHMKRPISSKMLIEKVPYAMTAGAFAVIGYFGQSSISAIKKTPNLFENIIVALHGVVFYIEKLLLPINLSNLYPYPTVLTFKFYLYAAICIAVCYVVWEKKNNTTVLFGSLFFFISLLPVLQFIRFSQIFAADRFTYFCYIGLFYIIGIYASRAFEKLNKKVVLIACFIVTVFLSILTWNRCEVWKDNNSLWQDALSKYPNAF